MSHYIHLVCLQETNLYSLRQVVIPGFRLYRKDRSTRRKGGEVAILVKKDIPYSAIAPREYLNEIDVRCGQRKFKSP